MILDQSTSLFDNDWKPLQFYLAVHKNPYQRHNHLHCLPLSSPHSRPHGKLPPYYVCSPFPFCVCLTHTCLHFSFLCYPSLLSPPSFYLSPSPLFKPNLLYNLATIVPSYPPSPSPVYYHPFSLPSHGPILYIFVKRGKRFGARGSMCIFPTHGEI